MCHWVLGLFDLSLFRWILFITLKTSKLNILRKVTSEWCVVVGVSFFRCTILVQWRSCFVTPGYVFFWRLLNIWCWYPSLCVQAIYSPNAVVVDVFSMSNLLIFDINLILLLEALQSHFLRGWRACFLYSNSNARGNAEWSVDVPSFSQLICKMCASAKTVKQVVQFIHAYLYKLLVLSVATSLSPATDHNHIYLLLQSALHNKTGYLQNEPYIMQMLFESY